MAAAMAATAVSKQGGRRPQGAWSARANKQSGRQMGELVRRRRRAPSRAGRRLPAKTISRPTCLLAEQAGGRAGWLAGEQMDEVATSSRNYESRRLARLMEAAKRRAKSARRESDNKPARKRRAPTSRPQAV